MPTPPTSDVYVGQIFGSYRIVRKLGEGGMGVVYEAEHLKIGRRAAVKLLHPQFARDDSFAQRFLNEARAVNVIRHRGLVEIFDFGKLPNGTLFYVMEFLEGASLSKRIGERNGPFPESEVVGLGVQIARALAAAHQAGIVHRDLKPANIMLEADPVSPGHEWVKVLDFGIAKFHGKTGSVTDPEKTDVATQVGSFMGTPLYMAPEQHGAAEQVDGRADVFSVGVMLYELLAGQLPFRNNALSLLASTPPAIHTINPVVSRRLSALVARMLSAQVALRPTMDEVRRELASMLPKAGLSAKRVAMAAGAIGLVLGAVLITLLNIERIPPHGEMRSRSREVLAKYLADPDPKVRILAIRALGQSRDFDQRSLLEPLVRQRSLLGPDAALVIEEAARALGQIGAADATVPILSLLSLSDAPTVKLAAASALSQLHHPRGLESLKQLLVEGDDLSRVQAALLLLEHRDVSGAELLWTSVARGRLSEEQRVDVLSRLARADDPQARQRLTEDLSRFSGGEMRVQIAYTLAQLGEDNGWDLLKAATRARDPAEQLLALRLLAGLGDAEQEAKLLALVRDRKQPDSIREQALAGLGDGGHHTSLPPIYQALEERGASSRLRIAAAGAILKITAGERARLGEQSLNYARAALGTDSMAMRELAVAMLADSTSEQAIPPLGDALRDREREIRRSAARALGRKSVRSAVEALKPALEDTDAEVRTIAVQSIGSLLLTLDRNGDREAAGLALAELRRLTTRGSERERVAASGVLFELGQAQSSERTILRNALASNEPQVRRLAIELPGVEPAVLQKALSDPDASVRLAAAQRLAAMGRHEGTAILRAAVDAGERDALAAFAALRSLGEAAASPPGLASLLVSGDVPTVILLLGILPELPADEARRLLGIAIADPRAIVRRRSAEAAADLYRKTLQTGFLRTVRSLRNDSDLLVRSQAAALAEDLATAARPNASAHPVDGGRKPITESRPDLGAPGRPDAAIPAPIVPPVPLTASGPATVGQLLLEGEELVRIQIDKNPPQPITGHSIAIASGRHRVSYFGGAQDVQVLPGQTVKIRVPVSLAEQLLRDSKELISRNEVQQAQENIDRVRRLLQRGRASSSLTADLAFQQGRLLEARAQLDAALIEYNRALNVPSGQRRPELNAALQSTLARLSQKVGRIQIFTLVNGQCEMTQEILSPPGEQVISLGKGQTRSAFAQVGSITKVTACQ